MRLHTGSKPFKCPFCELRFRTSGHRKTHIQCHFRPSLESRRSKRSALSSGHGQDPGTGQALGQGLSQQSAALDALQPVGLLQTGNSDPNMYLPASQVLTGQFDQNLLQQGLVGQAILPASMSGKPFERIAQNKKYNEIKEAIKNFLKKSYNRHQYLLSRLQSFCYLQDGNLWAWVYHEPKQ